MSLTKKTAIAIIIVVIALGALHFGGQRLASVIEEEEIYESDQTQNSRSADTQTNAALFKAVT